MVPSDPEGRRLARRRAAQLAEAGALLRAVEVLLRNAGFEREVQACLELTKNVAKLESAELQRAHGRIESRRRFKYRSGQPLLDAPVSNDLYLDESGTPEPHSTATQSAFALSGIAMRSEAAATWVEGADRIKLHFFGHTNVTFHEPSMRRHEQIYHFAGNRRSQEAFTRAVDELLQSTEFVVFGAGIRKDAFMENFARAGIDPYLPTNVYSVAILMLLERYVDYLLISPDRQLGRITFESQGPQEDAFHQAEFARLLLDGTQWVPESAFQQAIEPGARFVPKCGPFPTEIADMFARDLFEWTRSSCTYEPPRWELFTGKMYMRDDGSRGRFGVKVFPDSDIRELVEAHRARRAAMN